MERHSNGIFYRCVKNITITAVLYMFLIRLIPPGRGSFFVHFIGFVLSLTFYFVLEIFFQNYYSGTNDTKELHCIVQEQVVTKKSLLWLLTGLFLVVICFTYLEVMQSYYFTKDDSYAQFLPVIIQGGRSIESGLFPTFNPYQNFGAPTASLGIYSLTYPVTYLAFFISKYLLMSEYKTLEVFALLHFLGGFVAIYLLFHYLRVRSSIAVIGAVSFIFSGFNLVSGRSWYYVLPVILYFPLLILSVITVQRKSVSKWKWVIFTAITIGLFFHAGNAQMWVYGLLFYLFSIIMFFVTGRIPFRKVKLMVTAILLGLALAMPLLYVQFLETRDLVRGTNAWGIINGLGAMILPYPFVQANYPNWGPTNVYPELGGHGYYFGSFFSGLFVLGVLGFVAQIFTSKTCRKARGLIADNVWLISALVAFILALGDAGFLWPLMSKFPGFNSFKGAFKFLPYLNIFIIISAAVMFERYLSVTRKYKYKEYIVFTLVLIMLFFHLHNTRTSHTFTEGMPYPSLSEPIAKISQVNQDNPQRIMSFPPGTVFPLDGGVSTSFSTIYNMLTVTGRELLIAKVPIIDTYDKLKAYGIKWVIEPGNSNDFESHFTGINSKANKILANKNLCIWELEKPDPLAFAKNNPQLSLPIRWHTRGADIDVSSVKNGEVIVVNTLRRKYIHASVNGRELPVNSDSWSRTVVELQEKGQTLRIRYSPPWHLGFITSILLTAISLAMCFIQKLH